jgi:hypothetical protein
MNSNKKGSELSQPFIVPEREKLSTRILADFSDFIGISALFKI